MGRHSGFKNSILGLSLLTFSMGIHAQTVTNFPAISAEMVAVNNARMASNGTINATGTFRASIPPDAGSVGQQYNTKYYDRAVNYQKDTMGKLGKSNALRFLGRTAVGAVLTTALMYGIGWSLDQITGDIYPALNNGSSPALSCNPSFSTTSSIAAQSCTISGINAEWKKNCDLWAKPNYGSASYCSAVAFSSAPSSATYTVWCSICNGYAGRLLGPYSETIEQTASYSQPATAPNLAPSTNNQIADVVWSALSPAQQTDLLRDPVSKAPVKTAEVLEAERALTNEIKQQHGDTPLTAPITSPTQAEINAPITSAPTSFPSFCSYATTLCDWLGWTKEDYIPDTAPIIPEQNILVDTGIGFQSSIGNSGTCPQPITTTVMGKEISFPFTLMCQFASALWYVFNAIALLLAAFILTGYRKRAR